MKTKIKLLIILIATFVVTLVAGLITGCSIGEITAEQQAKDMGFTCRVTYYANGGTFRVGSDDDAKAYRTVLYRPDKPILNIQEYNSAVRQPVTIYRDNYVFDGWDYCVLDEDGHPVLKDMSGNILPYLDNGSPSIKDEATGLQISETAKKFTATPNGTEVFPGGASRKIQKGETLYLAAKWVKASMIDYVLVTDTPITVLEQNENGEEVEKTYDTGDVFYEQGFGSTTSVTVYPRLFNPNLKLATENSHSYIHLYEDPACEKPIVNSKMYQKPAEGEEYPKIYAKYLSGKWTPLREHGDVAGMFNAENAGNYFLVYDIDCANNTSIRMKSATFKFNHVVEGNGHTISNIKIGYRDNDLYGQRLTGPATYSVFGTIGADAAIRNLTIENLDVKVQVAMGNVSLFLLTAGVTQGATFDDFTVTGEVKLDVNINTDGGAMVPNMYGDKKDNWLYGGFNTDAEFESTYGEIVKDAQLIIS